MEKHAVEIHVHTLFSLGVYKPWYGTFTDEDVDIDSRSILTEVHNMLHQLVKRVESTENELKEVKKKISTPSSSDRDSGPKKKADIDPAIRVSCW